MGLLNEEAKESFVLSSKHEEVPAAHSLIDRGWGSIGPHLQGGQGVEAGRAVQLGFQARAGCLRTPPPRHTAPPPRHTALPPSGIGAVGSTSADVWGGRFEPGTRA